MKLSKKEIQYIISLLERDLEVLYYVRQNGYENRKNFILCLINTLNKELERLEN